MFKKSSVWGHHMTWGQWWNGGVWCEGCVEWGVYWDPPVRLTDPSLISSNFNYCPLVWFFTSRASINKIQKLQERVLRFVLKDSTSDYETLMSKSDFDSFRISSIKTMAVEIYKILNGMSPEYLSSLFSKSNVPYQLRDSNSYPSILKTRYPCVTLYPW